MIELPMTDHARLQDLESQLTEAHGEIARLKDRVNALVYDKACLNDDLADKDRALASLTEERNGSRQLIQDAHKALDEIGAPLEDGIGLLTLAGRCWAVSNRWSEEHTALTEEQEGLRAKVVTLTNERDCAERQCADHQRGENDALNELEALTAAYERVKAKWQAEVRGYAQGAMLASPIGDMNRASAGVVRRILTDLDSALARDGGPAVQGETTDRR